jgi:hypothetical protein
MHASRLGCRLIVAAMVLAGLGSTAARAQVMIIGNDQKPGLDAQRKPTMGGPGKDTLSIELPPRIVGPPGLSNVRNSYEFVEGFRTQIARVQEVIVRRTY